MERAQYEAIVREAIDALPEHLRARLADVAIVFDDRDPPARGRLLLGLYEGVPLTEWGRDLAATLPDKITLFTGAIEAATATDDEIPNAVRETLWHEIAHFFGFEHDKIHEMEERWRQKRGAAL